MGLFGILRRADSKIKESGKRIVKTSKVKLTNMWAKYSGKDKFEEADRVYEAISERYNKRRDTFEKDVNRITDQIEKRVNTINLYKKKIKSELFVEMATNLEKIQDIEFSKDFNIEAYKNAVYSFDSMHSKSDLYLINFHKNKFKTRIQAVFTLGFYTRKKAQETLYKVQEEEKKVEHEITKMDAEILKLKVIETSLRNVEHYFSSLIRMYEQLLVRLNNNVHYLYFRCMRFAHKLVQQEMSIKRLPVMQQKELEAIITASKILKVMTETQIVSLENEANLQKYDKEMKENHQQMTKVYEVA